MADRKLGTPMKAEPSAAGPSTPRPAPAAAPAITPPLPVIPTSWLLPHEQRWVITSILGLVEIMKIWDILAPYFLTNLEPTWSSAIRLSGPYTAILWFLIELSSIFLISLLRIPMLSPSPQSLVQIVVLLAGWNLLGWVVSEPGMFWYRIQLFGPPALGTNWYLAWWYPIKNVIWKETPHISGIHHIRLLPYSTATLNPMSLTYCIPPDSPAPIHIPVVFNNSSPDQVSYYIKSLDTGKSETKTVAASSMKKTHHSHRLALTDDIDEDDTTEPEIDPLSALVLRNNHQEIDFSKLPSVKPADSLALVPKDLSSSQNMFFITVDKPSVIQLSNVLDKAGDRFHITPHKEAVIIECPTFGHFVDHQPGGQVVKKGDKPLPAELRCVGDQEVLKFQLRGVGTLKAGWKKKSRDSTESGIIEGIEDDDIEAGDTTTTTRRDRISKTHTVPLRLSHDIPGIYTVSLTSITDSLHNTYNPSGHSSEKVFNVVGRPSARFDCPAPVQLLKDRTATIQVSMEGNGPLPGGLEVKYAFKDTEGKISTLTLPISKRGESIQVKEPGTYTLLEVTGQCAGSVLEPSNCVVQLVPPPTVDMTTTTLHECAMDVGVTASFDFTGTPPFLVEYSEQRKGSRLVTRSKRFDSHHGQIVLQPEYEGQYTYSFNTLSDRQYSKIKLDKPPITQVVHPLANVDIIGRGDGIKRMKLFACSGDQVDFDVESKGTGPLQLNYLKTWGTKSENITINIPTGKSKVSVPVPPELGSDSGVSGKLAISLLSITDGNGCERKLLNGPTVEVDINRQRPTARFVKAGEKVVITEGDVAKAGLRLTGTGPWEVYYTVNHGKEKRVILRDPNNALSFETKGTYRLTQVKDAHCPGNVLEDASTFEIDFRPRPEVSVVTSPAVTPVRSDQFKHKGLCAGEEDQVAIRFQGEAPFELTYRHTREGHTSRHTLKSAQEVGILHLDTEPGSHRYDFMELKDTNYPRTDVSFSLEHEVHGRPSASFVRQNTKPNCLDSQVSGDARIRLQGKSPWTIGLSIRKPASTVSVHHSIEVSSNEWNLELPYKTQEVGRHEITITSLSDQSGCEWNIYDSDKLSTVVEVVESARIVPVSQVEDLCVGDRLDFLLQGKAPWTIEYEWLGRKYKESSSETRFSRVAEKAGTFSVKSVALKDNQCKREIHDLLRTVHPLPSVKIQEGLDNLREGDEPAAFSVTFQGTPPFTFTYTRSEIINGRSKVVDTQTVTDIMEKSHTISSSQPGDYMVSSIADRYCRYPPIRGNEQ